MSNYQFMLFIGVNLIVAGLLFLVVAELRSKPNGHLLAQTDNTYLDVSIHKIPPAVLNDRRALIPSRDDSGAEYNTANRSRNIYLEPKR